jgi:hypothetical protein
LERVRHPEALIPHVGNALVLKPVLLAWEGLVEAVVEVLVMREDNMAADIKQLCGLVVVSVPKALRSLDLGCPNLEPMAREGEPYGNDRER